MERGNIVSAHGKIGVKMYRNWACLLFFPPVLIENRNYKKYVEIKVLHVFKISFYPINKKPGFYELYLAWPNLAHQFNKWGD